MCKSRIQELEGKKNGWNQAGRDRMNRLLVSEDLESIGVGFGVAYKHDHNHDDHDHDHFRKLKS